MRHLNLLTILTLVTVFLIPVLVFINCINLARGTGFFPKTPFFILLGLWTFFLFYCRCEKCVGHIGDRELTGACKFFTGLQSNGS